MLAQPTKCSNKTRYPSITVTRRAYGFCRVKGRAHDMCQFELSNSNQTIFWVKHEVHSSQWAQFSTVFWVLPNMVCKSWSRFWLLLPQATSWLTCRNDVIVTAMMRPWRLFPSMEPSIVSLETACQLARALFFGDLFLEITKRRLAAPKSHHLRHKMSLSRIVGSWKRILTCLAWAIMSA